MKVKHLVDRILSEAVVRYKEGDRVEIISPLLIAFDPKLKVGRRGTIRKSWQGNIYADPDKHFLNVVWDDGERGAVRPSEVKKIKESRFYEDTTTQNISVSHPGLLKVPAGKKVWNLPLKHFISLAKKKGKSAVMKGLLNLERWNKNKNPEISKKVRDIIDRLKNNKEWQEI